MAFERRQYSGNAIPTTLSAGLGTVETSIGVAAATGWPDGSVGPFFATIDEGTSTEERIKCTGRSGNTLTGVTRGTDGTAAASHVINAPIIHSHSKTDLDEANQHYYDTTLNHHTQYPLKSLWSAKGTILAATAASTPAGLAVGSDGQVLTADAASAGGVKWSSSGNGLLSHVQYAPDPAATYVGTAAVAALDTTHMRLPDFTPTTNTVRVTISGFINDSAAADGKRPAICVITQGTTTVLGALMAIEGGNAAYAHTFHCEEYVTVVSGTTYHWDVGWVAQGTSGPTIYAYGGTTVGSLGGPLVCSVFAV